jgi:hypothetical protein
MTCRAGDVRLAGGYRLQTRRAGDLVHHVRCTPPAVSVTLSHHQADRLTCGRPQTRRGRRFSRSGDASSAGADGTGAAEHFYQVRSNVSHRGKSAFNDPQQVHKAVTELHDAMRILVDRQVPSGGR